MGPPNEPRKRAAPPRPEVVLCGTTEPPPAARRLRAGCFDFELEQGTVRAVSAYGREIVRGLSFVARDANWGTCEPAIADEELTEDEAGVRHRCTWHVMDGAMEVRQSLAVSSTGRTVEVEATATALRDVTTNRTGFVVLHPLDGVAGSAATVTHSDGRREDTAFPQRISPGQPVFDMAAIEHVVHGVPVTIAFAGETFEMEDQRNWSDASFKTYCRPLALPFPYQIPAGSTVVQSVRITVGEAPPEARVARQDAAILLDLGPEAGETCPEIALVADADTLPDGTAAAAIVDLACRELRLRLDLRRLSAAGLDTALSEAQVFARQVSLEAVVSDNNAAAGELAGLAEAVDRSGVEPASVMALPAAYLKSYQPGGPWPTGLSPEGAGELVRRCFPGVPVVGGMLTYFTELNRRPPSPDAFDVVSHESTAIVHAADDRSVMETLEGLDHVFADGRRIAGKRAYRPGLVAIAMRSNPYGAAMMPNPDQGRLPLTDYDPRQRGLFAAAWAIGAVAATAGSRVAAMALAAPAGAFGLVHRREPVDQPWFDDAVDEGLPLVFPLYHVVRGLIPLGGRPRLRADTDGDRRIAAVAVSGGDAVHLWIANLTADQQHVRLPGSPASARVFRIGDFPSAAGDPAWLDRQVPDPIVDAVVLDAYEFAAVELPATASGAAP